MSEVDLYREFPELLDLKKRQLEAEVAKTEAEVAKTVAEHDSELLAATLKKAEFSKLTREQDKLAEEVANLRQLREEHGLRLDMARIDVAQAKRAWDEDRAQDYWHKRYVFDAPVSDGSAQKLIRALSHWSRTDPECEMEIVINSPGGDVISGFAIIDFLHSLRDKGHMIRTHAIGMAASMAGVILQAGTVRSIGSNGILLIHQGSLGAVGNYGEVKDRVKLMEMLHERILTLFEDRAKPINPKTTKSYIKRNWERQDWWLSADDALRLGFVDEVR